MLRAVLCRRWLLLLSLPLLATTGRVAAQNDDVGPQDGADVGETDIDDAPATEPDTADAEAGDEAPQSTEGEELLARARALFREGVEHAEAGRFEPAAARFEEALSIRAAPAIHYNLASAQYELGQYIDAWNNVSKTLADDSTPAPVRTRAEELQSRLRTHVGLLTLTIGGDAEGLNVRLDATTIAPGQFGEPMAVEPGTHEIVASREGERVSRRELEIPAGAAVIVDMSLVATPGEAAQIIVQQDGAAAAPKKRPGLWVGVTVAALAAIAAAVVVTLFVVGEDEQGPVQGNFMPGVITWP